MSAESVRRLLPYAVASGPSNMAADEVLLEGAVAGLASLRFYGWSEPTVSLGYFQALAPIRKDPRLAGLPFVRRASGGLTLVHHHEVTYALALPAGAGWQTREGWPERMHRIIAAALSSWGIRPDLHAAPALRQDTPLCFRHVTGGDLCIHGSKIVGSAQRRQRGAILQHGGILLARSPATPELAGISELTGCHLGVEETVTAICRAFEAKTGWRWKPSDWTEKERERTEELVREKYATAAWHERR